MTDVTAAPGLALAKIGRQPAEIKWKNVRQKGGNQSTVECLGG